VIPDDEFRLMHDAGLTPTPDASVDPAGWAWWKALGRVPLPEQNAAERKRIGDAGEELTVEYERVRLSDQGYSDLAAGIRWVAQESDAYGFDVLSFVGDDHAMDPRTPLAIEVKSSAVPVTKFFRLFLSAHEWETSTGLKGQYVLYLWDGVDPGPPASSRSDRPFIVSPKALHDHLPRSALCGEGCGWHLARLELQL
jgi:hypothetical protein